MSHVKVMRKASKKLMEDSKDDKKGAAKERKEGHMKKAKFEAAESREAAKGANALKKILMSAHEEREKPKKKK